MHAPSRRDVLFGSAALGVTAVALPSAGHFAGSPEFDTAIPSFDTTKANSDKTVALVFSGSNQRRAAGYSLCETGAVGQLLVLGETEEDIRKLKNEIADRPFAHKVGFLHGNNNTMEEAATARKWLAKKQIEEVVIVTDDWHSQRCFALIAPLQEQGIKISLHSCHSINSNDTSERIKRGLTRIAKRTGLPIAGIPGVQIPVI